MTQLTKSSLNTLIARVRIPELVGRLHIADPQSVPPQIRSGTVLKGDLSVAGKILEVYIQLPRTFPYQLPLVYLAELTQVGQIPHILSAGNVCYVQPEGLMLDRHNPVGIVEDALRRVTVTLVEGISGANIWDFVDEFEAYWLAQKDIVAVHAFVEPNHNVHEIVALRKRDQQHGFVWVADEANSASAFDQGFAINQTVINALYIPLEQNTLLRPPPPDTFWSLDEIRSLIWQHLSTKNQQILKKLTTKYKHEELFVICLPRRSEGEVLFGIWCQGVEVAHPLLAEGRAHQLKPLLLNRKDKQFLLPRGGADHALTTKKVAIIGCGAVGGYAALELARLGILNLTLIDPDIMHVENIFRHVTGKQWLGKSKVDAVHAELKAKFPYLQVQPKVGLIEELLEKGRFDARQFDLIVVAVGDVSINLYLNKVFCQQDVCPPVIYGWLEAYGIGGHVLTTLNKQKRGCLECLYTPMPLDEGPMCDRSAFAAPGQTFAKNIDGCGSLFTPFSSLDALKTATLIVQCAGDVLLDRLSGNPLLDWKGDSNSFVTAGYLLSSRQQSSVEDLYLQRHAYINPRCRICGDGT